MTRKEHLMKYYHDKYAPTSLVKETQAYAVFYYSCATNDYCFNRVRK